jgi:hypothetical protein
MKNRRIEVKMTVKTHKKDEKDQPKHKSKPEKFAKIIYQGIVRYLRAKKRSKWRVNVTCNDVD